MNLLDSLLENMRVVTYLLLREVEEPPQTDCHSSQMSWTYIILHLVTKQQNDIQKSF